MFDPRYWKKPLSSEEIDIIMWMTSVGYTQEKIARVIRRSCAAVSLYRTMFNVQNKACRSKFRLETNNVRTIHQEILEGRTFTEIAEGLRTTRSAVAGVCFRYKLRKLKKLQDEYKTDYDWRAWKSKKVAVVADLADSPAQLSAGRDGQPRSTPPGGVAPLKWLQKDANYLLQD